MSITANTETATQIEKSKRPKELKEERSELRVEGPAWNNSVEYPALSSNEFQRDQAMVVSLIGEIRETLQPLKPLMQRSIDSALAPLGPQETEDLIKQLHAISEISENTTVLLMNLATYVNCERCVDGKNALAQKTHSSLMQIHADFVSTLKPFHLFLDRAPAEIVELYLSNPRTAPEEFKLRESRKMKDTLLSEAEETLLTRMRTNGPDAWGNLYDQIAGNLRCEIEIDGQDPREVGLAEAAGLIRDASNEVRQAAWTGIQEAWQKQETSAAAILNSLAGWRLEECRQRSHTREVDFLTQPLHMARIQRETLEAMLGAVSEEIKRLDALFVR